MPAPVTETAISTVRNAAATRPSRASGVRCWYAVCTATSSRTAGAPAAPNPMSDAA